MRKNLMLILAFFVTTILSATVINIPVDYATIQEGLNVAVEGDSVLVASGTYERIVWPETSSIKLIGNGAENCIIDANNSLNSAICITILSGIIDTTTVITGFTITNGLGYAGGGIYCLSSSPKLENLIINDNLASYGGGIYCGLDSDPSLSNVYITNNSAMNFGGGICCESNSSPNIKNVIIIDNDASGSGGGIYCWNDSSPSLENVTIVNNSVSGEYGGGSGITCTNNSDLSLVNVIISENSSTGDESFAGGINCASSNIDLQNVIISNNSASNKGGGIHFRNSISNLKNVTICENSAGSEGGGIYCQFGSSVNLVNCILWNDTPQEIYVSSDTVSVAYSNIQGGWAGIGNIDDDPLFVGSGNYSYSIQDLSPCVNSGTPDTTGLNLPEYDLAGNPRIYGGRIDMGAYENQNVVVGANENLIPNTNLLYKNYPNPFNPTTTISFSIPNDSEVEISIYNIKGQKIKTLTNNEFSKGSHSIIWNGDDETGKLVSSGVYFYKLYVNGKTVSVKKCMLLK